MGGLFLGPETSLAAAVCPEVDSKEVASAQDDPISSGQPLIMKQTCYGERTLWSNKGNRNVFSVGSVIPFCVTSLLCINVFSCQPRWYSLPL